MLVESSKLNEEAKSYGYFLEEDGLLLSYLDSVGRVEDRGG